MTRNAPAWIGLAVLLAAAAYLAAGAQLRPSEHGVDGTPQLAGAIGLLIVVFGAAAFGYRPGVHIALRQSLAWLAAAIAFAIVYDHRTEFREVGGPLLAEFLDIRGAARDAAPTGAPHDVAISAGRGGHFFVEAMINGSHVRLVADTGATLIALTAEDAARIGLDPSALDFTYRHRTANGIARAARVVLDEVTVGPITLTGITASVSEPGVLTENLLGMSFLSRLSSFQIRGDQLLLTR